ncbi:MAG: DUF4411 family protein [Opitutaceae bacterium]|nr:DUF4411 family protein [Opitutaceae bacterium]
MAAERKYVLDTNVFVQSKRRYYPFDLCPGFWDALVWHAESGKLGSIDRVGTELGRGGDELTTWAATQVPDGFFASTDDAAVAAAFGEAMTWVQAQAQFLPEAKAEFAGVADGWLIAYAKAKGLVLVTLEQPDPAIRKKVPIPNVCDALGIEYITTFQLLRELGAQLNWTRPPG